MTERHATAETPSARTTFESGFVRSLRRRLAAAVAGLTVARLGAVALALFAAYFALVVPADLALLLLAAVASVGVAAMVPVLGVVAVVRFVE